MRNKLPAILVILAVVGVLGYLAMGSVSDNLVYYWTPTELPAAGARATGATVRLGGQVKAGSVKVEGTSTTFVVEDLQHGTVSVRTDAIPPQMFREGIGVVVEGTLGADGVFASKRLMVKHDENYVPPKAGDSTEALIKSAKE